MTVNVGKGEYNRVQSGPIALGSLLDLEFIRIYL